MISFAEKQAINMASQFQAFEYLLDIVMESRISSLLIR